MKNKIINIFSRDIVILSSFLILLGMIFFPISLNLDPDFGWHLRLGEYMLRNNSLVKSYVGYNPIFGNLGVIDYQWLSDIVMYKLYHEYGYGILIVISFSAIALTYIIIYYLLRYKNITKLNSLVLLLILLMPLSMVFGGVRVQYLLFPIVAIIFLVRELFKNYWVRYFLYFAIFTIGVNFHGGGMFALVVIPLLLECDQLSLRKENFLFFIESQGLRILLLLELLIISLFLTPNGIELFHLMWFYLADNYYQTSICEWLPILSYPFLWKSAILPMSLYIFLFISGKYWKKLKPSEIILLLIFFFLSLKSRRTFPIFAIIFTYYSHLYKSELNPSIKKIFLVFVIMLFSLILFTLFVLGFANYYPKISKAPFNDSYYPSGAVSYIRENQLYNGNMLNPYGWGGYLSWVIPELKITIDGRMPHPIFSDKKSILEIYSSFYDEDENEIKKMLESNNIKYILVKKPQAKKLLWIDKFVLEFDKNIINNIEKPSDNLLSYLNNTQGEWKNIYEDDLSSIYILIK